MGSIEPRNRIWTLQRDVAGLQKKPRVMVVLEDLLGELDRLRFGEGPLSETTLESWSDDDNIYVEADLSRGAGSLWNIDLSIIEGRLFIRLAR